MPKANTINKKQLVAPAIAAAIVMMTAPMLLPGAFAAPSLHGGLNCRIVGDNDLRCTGDVSGLGGATTAEGTLSATVVVTTGCVTPSGSNEPRGLQRTTQTVSDTVEVNVESGRATFDITLSPENVNRDCPSANMTPIVVCATYSNVQLTVDPNSGPSRTFKASGTFSSC